MYKNIILILFFTTIFTHSFAQKDRKVSFVGGARSVINNNTLKVDGDANDSTTVKKNNGGYALIDLGFNIKPNKSTEIMGMFRIRNEFGGFWGAGVQIDVRQLWIKGVIANSIRYQVGDLNLKQTPFTLYNHHSDQIDSLPSVFALQKNIVDYEKFYLSNNTWRMQGANVDFGFTFNKFIQEVNVNAFINRLNATNFSNVSDRLMGGLSAQLIANKYFQLGYNTNNVFDLKGTVPDSNVFNNSVNTIDFKLKNNFDDYLISLNGEVGKSIYQFSFDTLAPRYDDYFINAYAELDIKKWNVKATLGFLDVGPDFRSIGAQSKDVNYNATPVYFNRYTNDQLIRPIGLFDIISNENIYNRTLSSRLATESPIYNNVLPFGIATNNRTGMYGKLTYKSYRDIELTGEYYNLSEIRGLGTLFLKKFEFYKLYAGVPINKLINTKKLLFAHVGSNMQFTKRKSPESVENIDLKSMQMSGGIRWEFAPKFELMGGIVYQTNNGNEYTAERNSYSEIIFYNSSTYKLNQQIISGGIRYNFSSNVYLASIYQNSSFKDKTGNIKDFGINQFGLIFNMLL